MNFVQTKLEGVWLIEPREICDDRGAFIKVLHKSTFEQHGLAAVFVESYYSTSKKDVIRGMHFQIPPMDHVKLVYVTHGSILDVVLDIREGSPTYGDYITEELSTKNRRIMYIPKGCAHGFLSLEDDSNVTYLQTTMYAPDQDSGIRVDSFGMKWDVSEPIISVRDQAFSPLADFKTPFRSES
jgi:dTDP-4-dehydrorhamnose 3,5-epimerase